MGLHPGAVYTAYPFLLWWLRIRVTTSSYYHHQIGSMTHCLSLGHETMVCPICPRMFMCSFFLIVICRHNSKVEDLKVALVNLSKLELSQLHIRTSKVSHNIHQVFGTFYWHRIFDYPLCNFNKIAVSIIPCVISISKSMPFFNSSMDGCLIWHCKMYARMLWLLHTWLYMFQRYFFILIFRPCINHKKCY